MLYLIGFDRSARHRCSSSSREVLGDVLLTGQWQQLAVLLRAIPMMPLLCR
ncbi:GL14779 [Drosophila persimilis]|uniref:GL14779 n=1 Tax=Drosophila persimilis TaxID=7234 RepID=B4GW54_DROPE|nr:GL14779 [Drosophila persimilis]